MTDSIAPRRVRFGHMVGHFILAPFVVLGEILKALAEIDDAAHPLVDPAQPHEFRARPYPLLWQCQHCNQGPNAEIHDHRAST